MDDVMLPYRTDWSTMVALLDLAKGKGVDRATLEARLGAGESLRETLNAVEQLGLATRDEAGDVRLTVHGDRLAYAASDDERRDELARAMLGYPPYAIPLERAVAEQLTLLESAWVERVWQVDMRLGQPRNRVEEARTFFFRLADEAGFGTYRRGVRGQPTRLDLSPDIGERLAALQDQVPASAPMPSPGEVAPAEPATPTTAQPAPTGVSLSITVDMTDWDIDKIRAFLQLVGFDARR